MASRGGRSRRGAQPAVPRARAPFERPRRSGGHARAATTTGRADGGGNEGARGARVGGTDGSAQSRARAHQRAVRLRLPSLPPRADHRAAGRRPGLTRDAAAGGRGVGRGGRDHAALRWRCRLDARRHEPRVQLSGDGPVQYAHPRTRARRVRRSMGGAAIARVRVVALAVHRAAPKVALQYYVLADGARILRGAEAVRANARAMRERAAHARSRGPLSLLWPPCPLLRFRAYTRYARACLHANTGCSRASSSGTG